MFNLSNETMNTSSCEVPERIDGAWLLVITIIGSVIVVVSVIGNGIIIVAFFKNRNLHKPCNVMLTNIAFCDLVFSLIGFPIYIIPDFVDKLYCNSAFAHFRLGVMHFLIQLCTSSLLITSFERFFGIQFPYKYHSLMTNTKSFIVVAVSWVVSIARTINVSFGFSPGVNPSRIIEIVLSYIGFGLTIAVYCRVYVVSRRHLIRDAALGVQTRYSKSQASVLIASVFLICWLFPLLVWLADLLSANTKYWRRLSILPPVLGTVINLYVYTYRMRDFKEAIMAMLRPLTSHTEVGHRVSVMEL